MDSQGHRSEVAVHAGDMYLVCRPAQIEQATAILANRLNAHGMKLKERSTMVWAPAQDAITALPQAWQPYVTTGLPVLGNVLFRRDMRDADMNSIGLGSWGDALTKATSQLDAFGH